MKKIASVFGLLLVAMLVLSVVGCAQDADDASSNVVYVGNLTEDGISVDFKMTFSGDKSWLITMTMDGLTMNYAKGTYTGDPSKDGSIY